MIIPEKYEDPYEKYIYIEGYNAGMKHMKEEAIKIITKK